MSSEVVISLKEIGKCYQIYDKPHKRLLQSVFRNKKRFYREFWALKGVSLDVVKGSTVGVVGCNGSGKTTLLQLIAGTLTPTLGECQVSGKIAALLALGAGFNPEYTGVENVYMYAAMLGLTRAEIKLRFKSICDFANIGDFINQPVKKYSNGMYTRLAFAVAVHVDADIMIVDEALAVGDEAFQRKCFAKLNDLKQRGVTLFFVSHASKAVVELCDTAILIDKGELLAKGSPKSIVNSYQKLLFAPIEKRDKVRRDIQSGSIQYADRQSESGAGVRSSRTSKNIDAYFIEGMKPQSTLSYENKGALIDGVILNDLSGNKVNVLRKNEYYVFRYRVVFNDNCENVNFGMLIKTPTGYELGGGISHLKRMPEKRVANGSIVHVEFTFKCSLNPGVYFLNCGVQGDLALGLEQSFLHRIIDCAMFRVLEEESTSTGLIDFSTTCNIAIEA